MKKKIAFVSGNFNILHPGHLRLLRYAKDISDELIVGVNGNKIAGEDASVDEKLRVESLKSCLFVDKVILIKSSLKSILLNLKPDLVVKGREYEDKENLENNIIKKFGGKIVFSSGDVSFSSQDLIQRELNFPISNKFSLPKSFIQNHNISLKKLKNLTKKAKNLRIAVIGDLILDKYIDCKGLGMSQEDTTIVVKEVESTTYIGGAGIVALHATGFGSKVDFFSVIGKDEHAKFCKENLKKKNLIANLFVDYQRPTTVKQRFKSEDKTLLRVSKLYQTSISKNLQRQIYIKIKKNIKNYDVLIFSDFNYGCLPQELVDKITKLAIHNKVLLAADSQSSSQNGNICRFKRMNLITPTEREARIASRNNEDGLIVLAEKIRAESLAQNIFIKLGPEGFLIDHNNLKEKYRSTDKMPVLNPFPRDTMGAGDALLISSFILFASGATIWEAGLVGAIASAIQVSRKGNIPINANEIIKILK